VEEPTTVDPLERAILANDQVYLDASVRAETDDYRAVVQASILKGSPISKGSQEWAISGVLLNRLQSTQMTLQQQALLVKGLLVYPNTYTTRHKFRPYRTASYVHVRWRIASGNN
jgi:hypothetical protein